jgi:hypothetical protein
MANLEIREYLTSQGVAFETIRHAPAYTAQSSSRSGSRRRRKSPSAPDRTAS